MRVGFATHEYPPQVCAVGTVVHELARALARRGHEITVVAGRYAGSAPRPAEQDFQVVEVDTPDVAPRYYWFQAFNRRRIADQMKTRGVQVFHGQSSTSALILPSVNQFAACVTTFHGSALFDLRAVLDARRKTLGDLGIYMAGFPVNHTLNAFEIIQSDRLTTFSEFMRNAIDAEFGRRDFAVIPPGVATDALQPRAATSPEPDRKTVVYAGRLVARKNPHLAIAALRELRTTHPSVRLEIVGDGPMKGFLVDFAKRLGVLDAVRFNGYLPRSAYLTLLGSALATITPSSYEVGLSQVMLESLARGTPVVCINRPYLVGVHDKSWGVITTTPDPMEIASRLGELLECPNLRDRLGTSAREVVERRFSYDTIVGQYERVYEEALSG